MRKLTVLDIRETLALREREAPMAEDWFRRCADIINMDVVLGQPSHVRLVPNEPDLVAEEVDFGEDGIATFTDFPDAWDDSTDTQRDFVVEVHFDAATDLEASLATAAIVGFVRRRLTLDNVVVIGRANNPDKEYQ